MSFARLFGSSDLDIITTEADLLASLPIGLAGMLRLTPYVGYGQVFIHVQSQVIDETPFLVTDDFDQQGGASGSLYTFPTIQWNKNNHHRILLGTRMNIALFELLLEWDMTLLTAGPKNLHTFSVKIGLDV